MFNAVTLAKSQWRSSLSVITVSTMMALSVTGCQKNNDAGAAQNGSATQSSSESSAAGKTIRVATEGTYKPFSITSADGTLTGFDVELMKALCSQMKATCDIKPQDWDGLLPGLMAKKYDVVIDAMSITPERQAQVDFTDPYFTNTLVFIAKKDSTINPDDPAQIDSHAIAAQRSTLSTQWLEKNHPKAKQKLYEGIDSAFMDLAAGRADMMISDKAPALYWVNTPEGQSFTVKGKEIDVNDKMAIVVRKGDPLRQDFNTAIAAVKASGEYDKIYNKYFGSTATTQGSASATSVSVNTATASAANK